MKVSQIVHGCGLYRQDISSYQEYRLSFRQQSFAFCGPAVYTDQFVTSPARQSLNTLTEIDYAFLQATTNITEHTPLSSVWDFDDARDTSLKTYILNYTSRERQELNKFKLHPELIVCYSCNRRIVGHIGRVSLPLFSTLYQLVDLHYTYRNSVNIH